MSSFTIRRATLDDLGELAPLFDGYRQFYKQPADVARAADFLRARLSNEESVVFVAVSDALVGFVQLYPSYSSVRAGRFWILNDLYVAPEGRRQGIGAQLLQASIDFAREHGALGLTLSTARDNYAAQAAYRAGGWIQDEAFLTFNFRLDSPS